MKLVTVAGPPSSGKTAVSLKTIAALQQEEILVGVVKFDSLSTQDQSLFEKQGIAAVTGLSGLSALAGKGLKVDFAFSSSPGN